MSSIRLADLAQQLNATLHGDGDLVITGIAPMHSANSGQITFLSDARYREKLGVSEESLAVTVPLTVAELMAQLAARGGAWQELFDCPRGVMIAINQVMAGADSLIADGDEVALFPPVTGG